jgi:predicted ATP-grasp superfamily ATP-dependent carboligase
MNARRLNGGFFVPGLAASPNLRELEASSRALGLPDKSAGALVIGGDYQGLSIVRSLGQRGVPICVVDDEMAIARFSKYTTKSVRLEGLREENSTIEGLLTVGQRLGLQGWVIYPTRDEHVAAISRHRDRLGKTFRVPTPGWESVQWAWDKRLTYRKANELGIPTPKTFYPQSLEDLKRIDFPPPYAVKPAIKEHFIYSTRAKAWRANDARQLRDLCEKASQIISIDEVMVQELIPGGGRNQVSYCAFFREGEPLGKMVVCRARQHPLEFGRASTYVETIDLPILEELSERFLRAIDYYGLVEVEYKLDRSSGLFKLLDVNARTWGYHGLGARAGVDFSYLLHCDQLGLPVVRSSARPGVRWMRVTTDFPTAVIGCLKGELKLGSYLSSLKDSNVEAVFSLKDPFPGMAELCLIPYLIVKKGF